MQSKEISKRVLRPRNSVVLALIRRQALGSQGVHRNKRRPTRQQAQAALARHIRECIK